MSGGLPWEVARMLARRIAELEAADAEAAARRGVNRPGRGVKRPGRGVKRPDAASGPEEAPPCEP